MRHCTLPKILGFRDWFERKFGDLCHVHDVAYGSHQVSRRQADLDMMVGMAARGYPALATLTYWLVLRPFGWTKWGSS